MTHPDDLASARARAAWALQVIGPSAQAEAELRAALLLVGPEVRDAEDWLWALAVRKRRAPIDAWHLLMDVAGRAAARADGGPQVIDAMLGAAVCAADAAHLPEAQRLWELAGAQLRTLDELPWQRALHGASLAAGGRILFLTGDAASAADWFVEALGLCPLAAAPALVAWHQRAGGAPLAAPVADPGLPTLRSWDLWTTEPRSPADEKLRRALAQASPESLHALLGQLLPAGALPAGVLPPGGPEADVAATPDAPPSLPKRGIPSTRRRRR